MAEKTKKEPPKQNKKSPAPKKQSVTKRSIWGSLFILSEAFAVLLLILAFVLGLSVWRLKSGPVDIGFSKEYIQEALRDEDTGTYVTLDGVQLHWPNLQGPLLLGIKDGRIFSGEGREIIFVDEVALSLSKTKILLGQIEPLSLIVRQPSLRIIRTVDNGLDFGFGTTDTIATQKIEEQSEDQENLVADILNAIRGRQEDVSETSPLASLRSLEIQDARAIIEDYKLETTWFLQDFDIRFDMIDEGLKTDMAVELAPLETGERSFLSASIILNEAGSYADFKAALQNFDLQIVAGKIDELEVLRGQDVLLNGTFNGRLDQNFRPVNVKAQIVSDTGNIQHDMISDEPLAYKDFKIDASYSNQTAQQIVLNALEITLGEATIRGKGMLSEDDENQSQYKASAELSIDDMPHSAIEPLWPNFLVGDNSEEWIVKKMSGGDLSGLRAEADFDITKTESEEWNADISSLMAYFDFENMDMDYRAPLPPVQNAKGGGVFDLGTDVLNIDIEQAEMGGMSVSKTGLSFTDVAAEGKGAVEMKINLNGSIRSVFEYISIEPIGLKEELDMDVAKVKGDTDLRVEMSFPTKADLKIEEIQMDVKGTVRNGFLPDILEGLPLEGGPFDVHVNNERYTVKGSGTFSGRPVKVDWIEYLNSKGKEFKSKADVEITIDEELRKHFGIDLTDFLEGSVPVDLVYRSLPENRAEIYIDADATPTTFFVQPFDYSKAPGQKGQATMTVHLTNNILNRISNLNASAPNFDLKNATLFFHGSGDQTAITQARLQRFSIGETIGKATIDVAPNGAKKVLLEGQFLDLRPFLNNDGEGREDYNEPPQVISVSVDQMRTSDDETVQYAKMYADIDNKGRFNQLEMDAIAGGGDVYMRYKPDAQGKRTFRFEADDAGAALRAFDVYDNIRGGKLVIYGEPISGVYDRNLIGVAQITDFKVVDAPSLARLLGALSLPGVLQLLNDDGLGFSKLEAGFDWLYRPQGALLVLKDGRTSGNSLGLTFDGIFDNAAMTVDVSGTIIPLSGINRVISSIPLIGDILSGGTGAIFAATYSMKGKSEEPQISVNPLSVLTPGILRRILFEQ